MFFNSRRRGMSKQEVVDWMDETFNVRYPKQGMLFAVGNQAKRPQVWQLLGVLRVDEFRSGHTAALKKWLAAFCTPSFPLRLRVSSWVAARS